YVKSEGFLPRVRQGLGRSNANRLIKCLQGRLGLPNLQIEVCQLNLRQVWFRRQPARLLPGVDGLGDSPLLLVKGGERRPGSFAGIKRDRKNVLLFRLGSAPLPVEQCATKPPYEGAVRKSRDRFVRCRECFRSAAKSSEKAGCVGPLIKRPGGRVGQRRGGQRCGCAVHVRMLNQSFRLRPATHEYR